MARSSEASGPVASDAPEESQQRYCFDTDALISLHEDGLLPKLKEWTHKGFVAIPAGVLRELQEIHVAAYKAVSAWEPRVFVNVEENPDTRRVLPRLFRDYGKRFTIGRHNYKGLAESPRGFYVAEFEVIALAKPKGWHVVSNERAVHGACSNEGVMAFGWETIRTLLRGGIHPTARPLFPL